MIRECIQRVTRDLSVFHSSRAPRPPGLPEPAEAARARMGGVRGQCDAVHGQLLDVYEGDSAGRRRPERIANCAAEVQPSTALIPKDLSPRCSRRGQAIAMARVAPAADAVETRLFSSGSGPVSRSATPQRGRRRRQASRARHRRAGGTARRHRRGRARDCARPAWRDTCAHRPAPREPPHPQRRRR